jgi:hypothetical protein
VGSITAQAEMNIVVNHIQYRLMKHFIDIAQYRRADMRQPFRTIATAVLSIAAIAAVTLSADAGAAGQTVAAPPAGSAVATPDNEMLLTIFLKHDQSRPLGELNAQLEKQGFFKAFPPKGMEVVSWTVAMGIGQVIVLRLPASRIREVNRVLEDTAWGAYRTEFYPTYDYKATALSQHDKAAAASR